jgi:hypothetical protein
MPQLDIWIFLTMPLYLALFIILWSWAALELVLLMKTLAKLRFKTLFFFEARKNKAKNGSPRLRLKSLAKWMNLKFAEVSPRLLTQSKETHSKVQRVLSLDDYGWRAPKFIHWSSVINAIATTDHKKIGRFYVFFGFFSAIVGSIFSIAKKVRSRLFTLRCDIGFFFTKLNWKYNLAFWTHVFIRFILPIISIIFQLLFPGFSFAMFGGDSNSNANNGIMNDQIDDPRVLEENRIYLHTKVIPNLAMWIDKCYNKKVISSRNITEITQDNFIPERVGNLKTTIEIDGQLKHDLDCTNQGLVKAHHATIRAGLHPKDHLPLNRDVAITPFDQDPNFSAEDIPKINAAIELTACDEVELKSNFKLKIENTYITSTRTIRTTTVDDEDPFKSATKNISTGKKFAHTCLPAWYPKPKNLIKIVFYFIVITFILAISIAIYLILSHEKVQNFLVLTISMFFYLCFNLIILFASIVLFKNIESLMYSIFSWAMPLQSDLHEFYKVQRQVAAELDFFDEEVQWQTYFVKASLSKIDRPNQVKCDWLAKKIWYFETIMWNINRKIFNTEDIRLLQEANRPYYYEWLRREYYPRLREVSKDVPENSILVYYPFPTNEDFRWCLHNWLKNCDVDYVNSLSLEVFYEEVCQCAQTGLLNDELSNEKAVIERFGDANFQTCLQADEFFPRAFQAIKTNYQHQGPVEKSLRGRVEDSMWLRIISCWQQK